MYYIFIVICMYMCVLSLSNAKKIRNMHYKQNRSNTYMGILENQSPETRQVQERTVSTLEQCKSKIGQD